jgi:hypothetical protein
MCFSRIGKIEYPFFFIRAGHTDELGREQTRPNWAGPTAGGPGCAGKKKKRGLTGGAHRSGIESVRTSSRLGLLGGAHRWRGRARRRSSTRKAREAPASCSPAEELLLLHLVQAAARGRLWNAGNGRALRSLVHSGELEPASNKPRDYV